MPQFVQGDFWPAVSLCRLTEQLGYVVRVIRRPIFPSEDVSIVLVIVAPERLVFLLLSPNLCKTLLCRREERKCAETVYGFSGIFCFRGFHPDNRVLDADSLFLIINGSLVEH